MSNLIAGSVLLTVKALEALKEKEKDIN